MDIKIDVDELDEVISKIDYLIENTDYIQTCILSQLDSFDNEKLFGITGNVNDKLTELDGYNNGQLATKLTEIKDEISELKNNFIDQDDYNRSDING